jgi:nitrite reductase/ring-hydroxylating ferredoxin subunit
VELCALEDLINHHSKGFVVNDQDLFVIRKNDKIYAYKNSCPHLGIQLNWQEDSFLTYEKELIQCSTHGALFNIHNGLCVAGPCSGQSLQEIPVTVKDGKVLITLD